MNCGTSLIRTSKTRGRCICTDRLTELGSVFKSYIDPTDRAQVHRNASG